MSSGYSPLLACPPEIHLEIIEHLQADPKRIPLECFSLTSKLLRSRALPYLFNSLWLSRDSVAAFSDGGKLSPIRSYVRTLYISNKRYRRGKIYRHVALVENLAIFAKSLHLFPSATDIAIRSDFDVPKSIQNNVYIALWRAISSFPNFKNVDVCNGYTFTTRTSRESPRDPYGIFLRKLSPEAQNFLGPVGVSNEELWGGYDISPHAQSFENIHLDTYELELEREVGFASRSFFFGLSCETIKVLDLNINLYLVTVGLENEPITIRFPNVRKIMLRGGQVFRGSTCQEVLNWFAQACPNTESLELSMLEKYTTGLSQAEYDELKPMHKLKDLMMPWPRNAAGRYKQSELNEFIHSLMYAGLENLETLMFARIPGWNIYYNEHVFRKCRIDRNGIKGRAKIIWRKSYRYIEVEVLGGTLDPKEIEEGDDSEDDLDENPPEGAVLSHEWVRMRAQALAAEESSIFP
ncbi:hypothetical protein TWF481_001410 [Arthrobotrys musiformis]|uniref:F-box domain-containing protein n=1 Tax=Arthrobotrys musiformis TaxID=47236 RepID=A0AAV9WQL5_9PEZI